jgi:vacuolar protein sorting-associated protein 16
MRACVFLMCRKLRVLNAIRSAEVGVPLTAQQYDTIGAEAVIGMLIRRRLHLLALKVSTAYYTHCMSDL